MNKRFSTHTITHSEAGEILSGIHVTEESNGMAVWFELHGFSPRLLAYHFFKPKLTREDVTVDAFNHAELIAKEARHHGEPFAAMRAFSQC